MKNREEKTTVTESLSSGTGWREIQEQQGWEDFLAWCREQESAGRGE